MRGREAAIEDAYRTENRDRGKIELSKRPGA